MADWRLSACGGRQRRDLGAITQELHDIAESFTLTSEERAQRLQQLADNGIRQIREEQELEAKQSELFGLNVPSQSWRDDIAAAQTYWLSPEAIQRCVTRYLVSRVGADGEYLLGEKPLKTLRLNQEARTKLLEDYKRLPRFTDPVAREWQKWLKGTQPLLSVTFEQEMAVENPKAAHLTVLHPLVRQAAAFLDVAEARCCAVTVQAEQVPPSMYPFALYRWTKHGIKPDEALIAVAHDPQIEGALFDLLQAASEPAELQFPDAAVCDSLDVRHHAKWFEAQANHMAHNRELAEHRIQSLTASHRARCRAIEDQLNRATNDKIRLMRESELARAQAEFDRRIGEFNLAAASGDIRAAPVVFGTITVTKGGSR